MSGRNYRQKGFTLSGFTLIRTLLRKNLDKVQPLRGFTLIELLIVMAILGILATVGLNNFRISQMKSRDARRKSDLAQIQRALEMYFNDKGTYPPATEMVWGSVLVDPNRSATIYIKELPNDPAKNRTYCYNRVDQKSYRIYAILENSQDQSCLGGVAKCSEPQGTCNGQQIYNYGVASPNLSP